MQSTKCLPSNNKLFTYYGQSLSGKQATLLQLFLFFHSFSRFPTVTETHDYHKNSKRLFVVKCSVRDFLQ